MGKILVVDDHPVIWLGVRALLEREGHVIVAETDNGINALSLTKELMPDLVVLDLTIPKLDGLEVLGRFKSLFPTIPILILTAHDPLHFAQRCKTAGAVGFVSKEGAFTELVGAVKAILSGYTYFPNLAVQVNDLNGVQKTEAEQLANLSNRELTVLQFLAAGMLNKNIAERMLIGEKTVSTYKSRLLVKLNMNSLLELIEFAKRNDVGN